MNILIFLMELGADVGMAVGPCVGYVVQIRKMHTEKISEGFSTYVSFILILSNLIRVFWWYIERFSTIILLASIFTIIIQMILLYVWVYVNRFS